MATFVLVLSPYKQRDGKQSILLRITIDRVPIPRTTDFAVLKKDWDNKSTRVKATHPNHVEINDALIEIKSTAEREFANVRRAGYRATSKAIADKTTASHDFFKTAQEYIDTLTGPTQLRTQEGLQSSLKKIKKFSPTLYIEQITPDFLKEYRKWLETTPRNNQPGALPIVRTTVIKRLDNFRKLYNESPHKITPSPFESIVIGEGKRSTKPPLSITEITALWNYEPLTHTERLAKDTFLFSFYAMGMRIGDVLQMRWDYVKDDRVEYDQTKKQHLESDDILNFPLNKYLDEILDRWPKVSPYVFNTITKSDPRDIVEEIDRRLSATNPVLKMIALRCGITKWISAKHARPTFADIANKRTGRNIYAIQVSMGHAKISTTEGYIGKDMSAIDEVAKATYE